MANISSAHFSHITSKDISLTPFNPNGTANHVDQNVQPGTIRYNNQTNTFEGYLSIDPTLDNPSGWAQFNLKKAGTNQLGGVSVGSNLYVDQNGKMSSFAYGISKIDQNVITVSKSTQTQASQILVPSFDGSTNIVIDSPPSSYSSSDFNTISEAIDYINGLTGSNVPSENNPYIILVSPGVYSEQLFLTSDQTYTGTPLNYVGIMGTDMNNTIIEVSNNPIVNSSTVFNIMMSGINCFLKNLTIKNIFSNALNMTKFVGLRLGNQNSYNAAQSIDGPIVIENVKFSVENITNTNICLESIYTNALIKDCSIIMENTINTNNNNVNIGISLSDLSITKIHNTQIDITRRCQTNIGIKTHTCNNTDIENTNINITGFANNFGLDNTDTSYNLYKSTLDIKNYVGYTSFGIRNTAPTGFVLNPIEVRFISNQNNKDVIKLNPSGGTGGSLQFNNLKNDQFININITNDQSHNNNKLVKIFSVENSNSNLSSIFDILVLNSNYTLETYPTSVSYVPISITAYYSANIINSIVKGGTHSIFNSQYYYLNNKSSIFEEGLLSINDGIFSSTYYNVITVGTEKADFLNLSTALNSIIDNSSSKRYLIRVYPGNYTESIIINMKQYVDIIGDGKQSTIINLPSRTTGNPNSNEVNNTRMTTTNSLPGNSGIITLASDCKISNIQFVRQSSSDLNLTTSSIFYYIHSSGELPIIEDVIINNYDNSQYNAGIVLEGIPAEFNNTIINNSIINVGKANNTLYKAVGILVYNTINNNNNIQNITQTKIISNSTINIQINSNHTNFNSSNLPIPEFYNILSEKSNLTISNCNLNIQLDTATNNTISSNLNRYFSNINSVDSNFLIESSKCFNGLGNTVYNEQITNKTIILKGCILETPDTKDYINTVNISSKFINCYDNIGILIKENGVNYNVLSKNLFLGDFSGFLSESNLQSNEGNTFLGNNSGYASNTSIGRNTFIGAESGRNNKLTESVSIGYRSGYGVENNSEKFANIIIGNFAGENSDGEKNILLGYQSGQNVSGNNNIFLGYTTGMQTQSSDNIFIGNTVGTSNTTGQYNLFIGSGNGCGINNQTGSNNVFLGYESGRNNVDGVSNVHIGFKSGYNNTSNHNLFLGSNSGELNTSGEKNIFLGTDSGKQNRKGNSNCYIGYRSGYNSGYSGNYDIDDNTFLGFESGYNSSSGQNTIIGSLAGYNNNIGMGNTLLGYSSGKNNRDGNKNISIGFSSNINSTQGDENIYIGVESGSNNEGSNNLCIGSKSGFSQLGSSASNNIYLGLESGYYNKTGNSNIYLGINSGKNNESGDFNIHVGTNSGESNLGNNNIFIGYQSGKNNTNADSNINIGNSSGFNNLIGTNNLFLGNNSGLNSNASNNIFIGESSGKTNISGDTNLYLGNFSGFKNIDGNNNTFMGYQTGYECLGFENNFIGKKAGYNSIYSNKNIFIGNESGSQAISSRNNIMIGYKSGFKDNTTNNLGENNIMMGASSGASNTTGQNNIFMGSNSGYNNTTGRSNIIMGNNSGYQNTTGFSNFFLGYKSGYNNLTGRQNIFLGEASGFQNITGYNNIFIGTGESVEQNVYNNFIQLKTLTSNEVGLLNSNEYIKIYFTTGVIDITKLFINLKLRYPRDFTGLYKIYKDSSNNTLINTVTINSFQYNYIYIIPVESSIKTIISNYDENTVIVGNLPYSNTYLSSFSINTNSNDNISLSNQLVNLQEKKITFTSGIDPSSVYQPEDVISIVGLNSQPSSFQTDSVKFINSNSSYFIEFTNNSTYQNIKNIFIQNSSVIANSYTKWIQLDSVATNTSSNYKIYTFVNYNDSLKRIQVLEEVTTTTVANNTNIYIVEARNYIIDNVNSTSIDISLDINKNLINFQNLTGETQTYFKFLDIIPIVIEINSGVGYNNSVGNQNILVGFEAGFNNSNSSNIIAFGTKAAYNNKSSDIICVGTESGFNNTDGINNICFGKRSGYTNINGKDNILIGTDAGYNHTSSNMISIGSKSGFRNTSGQNNVFIGTKTGYSNTSGTNNLFLGSGLEIAYNTPEIPDVNFSLYSGMIVRNLNTSFLTDNIISNFVFYNNLIKDDRFKIFAFISQSINNQLFANAVGYGYLTTYQNYNFSKFYWPTKEINGIGFNKDNYPDGTYVYINYSDNQTSLNSSITEQYQNTQNGSIIPKIQIGSIEEQLSYDKIFIIKHIDSNSFYLTDTNDQIVVFLAEDNEPTINAYFYYNESNLNRYNYFYFTKSPFQRNDIVGIANSVNNLSTNSIDTQVYKVNSIGFYNLQLESHFTHNNTNIKSNLLTQLEVDNTIINYSNNKIEFVYPVYNSADNTYNHLSDFNSIMKFTVVGGASNSYLKLNFKVSPDIDTVGTQNISQNVQNFKKLFEIPIVKNDKILLKKNTSEATLPSELDLNTPYYVSDIHYYKTSGNMVEEINRVILNGTEINMNDNTFTYPDGSTRFSNNDRVYIISNNKTPIITQSLVSVALNQYRYYYVKNLDNDATKFKLSFSVDGQDLLNFSSGSPVTNSGNTFSNTDYFIIGKTDDIDEVRINLSDLQNTNDYKIINSSQTFRFNSIIVGETPYMSYNTNISNELSTLEYNKNTNIINIHDTLGGLPYVKNNSGLWWGKYNNDNVSWYNNIYSIYYNSYKTNSQTFNPGDNLDLDIDDNISASDYANILNEISNINNLDSMVINAIVTIVDNNNNFIEERIYFTQSNQNINIINNLNTYLNTNNVNNNSYIKLKFSIPKSTGYSNTTGNNNTFIGDGSGFSNTQGNLNTFIGSLTGFKNNTGKRNIYIGNQAGYLNSAGEDNVLIGTNSGFNNTVSNNIFIGSNTGFNNNIGENNIFMGNNSGFNNVTSSNNIFLGKLSGKNTGKIWNQNSDNNLFLGSGAGYQNRLGNRNVCIGLNSGYWIKDQKNKFVVDTQIKSNTTSSFVNNKFNLLYITLESLEEFDLNDYIRIVNSLDDEEIVKIKGMNDKQLSKTYSYLGTELQFVASSNTIIDTPYFESTLSNYDFTQNTNFTEDQIIYIENNGNTNNGIYIIDSVSPPTTVNNSRVSIFTAETNLNIHFPFYSNLNQPTNINISGSLTTNNTFTATTPILDTNYTNDIFIPNNKIQDFNRDNTTTINSIKLSSGFNFIIPNLDNPEQADTFNNSINNVGKRTFTSMFWFKASATTTDIFTIQYRSLDNSTNGTIFKLFLANISSGIGDLSYSDNQVIAQINLDSWYHISIKFDGDSNTLYTYLNGDLYYIQSGTTYSSSNSLSEYISLTNSDYTNYSSTNNRIFFRLNQNTSFHDLRIYYNQSSKILISGQKINFIYNAYADNNLRIPGTNESNTTRQGILGETNITSNININTQIVNIQRQQLNINKLDSVKNNLVVWYNFDKEVITQGILEDSNLYSEGYVLENTNAGDDPYSTTAGNYASLGNITNNLETGRVLNCINLTKNTNNNYFIRIGKTIFNDVPNINPNIILNSNILNGGFKFTISCWINIDSIPAENTYYSIYSSAVKDGSSFETNRGFNLYLVRKDADECYLALHDGNNNKAISSSSGMVYNNIHTIKASQWTFICLKFDDLETATSSSNGKISLYVNNKYITLDNWISSTNTKKVIINNGSVTTSQIQVPMIGNYQNNDYFNGKIDDFRFFETELLDEDIKRIYNQRIDIDDDSTFLLLKSHKIVNAISTTDNLVILDTNKYFAINDVIRINNEYMKVMNVADNEIMVLRGHLGSFASDHTNSSIVFLKENNSLISSNTDYNNISINYNQNDTKKIDTNEKQINPISDKYKMLIGGSIGINGEIMMKNSVPMEPPKGYSMLWFSNGEDNSFSNSDNFVTNNKLTKGLYLAHTPMTGDTIYTQISNFDTYNKWSNPFKDKTIDVTNVIHCKFSTGDYGLPSSFSLPYKLNDSNSTSLNHGRSWVSGIGQLKKVGTVPIDFFELSITNDFNQSVYTPTTADLKYANSWQITDKFLISQGDVSLLDYNQNYLIPSTASSNLGYTKISNNEIINRPYRLQGNNGENAICVPNTGPQLNKINGISYKEFSYLLSPYFINNNISYTYWGSSDSGSTITLSNSDAWFSSARIVTFESFNNTDGYWPSTWYNSQVAASLYDKELVKYRILTKEDISSYLSGSDYTMSYTQIKTEFEKKKWLTLKGIQLNTSNNDLFYEDIETDIQDRSYEVDKSNNKYAGSDGTDSDEGIGWITYQCTIPKCVACQLIFTYSTENISFGPSNGHVSGWYLRNLKMYKKI